MASEESELVRRRDAGRWLRSARERRGFLTGDALARQMGVTPGVISRYETGVSRISDERAEQIAAALGMDIIEVRRGLRLWVPTDSTGPSGGEVPEDDPLAALPEDPEERREALTEMLDERTRETREIAAELAKLMRESG